MKKIITCAALAIFASSLSQLPIKADGPQLAHMVFFQLNKDTKANRNKLVQACHKYLSGHKGEVYFSVGVIVEEHKRDVNVRDFDVALHIVFKDKAAQDRYQKHPRHLQFIKENKDLWKNVRVFDSYLVPAKNVRAIKRRSK